MSDSTPMIRKLPEDLICKIAAGEVIERPASVVKELVENAIDAGAREIQIEIEDGGRQGICVVDDGCGMSPEGARLALERHATSKLPTDEDLFRICTLGFRGEALPSIAAVSWLTLESRGRIYPAPTGISEGIRIEIEGGKIVKQGPSALPVGTRISVRNLFFNTPARLKFMKGRETEFSHISHWVETIALAYPQIGFTLTHQGKRELFSPPRANITERVRDVLGVDLAGAMISFQGGRGGLELFGVCSRHDITSGTSRSLYLFVNGRAVRDRLLQHAVIAAYENLLMKGRYPWVVLYLQVPPDFVDVNVHPTKNEVRFAQSQGVHELVRETIRGILQERAHVGAPLAAPLQNTVVGRGDPVGRPSGDAEVLGDPPGRPYSDLSGGGVWPYAPTEYQESFKSFTSSIRVIGQVHQTYLVCENDDKLILIDQHAAHERIGFEKLKRQFEAEGIARQRLLIPENFDLTPSDAEILKKYLPDLEQFGLEVEFFGGHTFILRTVPVLLSDASCVALIQDLIQEIQAFEKLTPIEERVHEILERMACHAQVRAGDRLTPLEIEALLAEMEQTRFAYSCPHGRPALLQIPFGEIEKWFRRKI